MKQLISQIVTMILLTTFIAACGGTGTTIVGNPSTSDIAIGKLNGGASLITIPLEAFGDSASDVSGATIDVEINGVLTDTGIDAATYYNSSSEAVIFNVSSLQDGDTLTFLIHKIDGTTVSYSGTVSSTADTTATSSDEVLATGSTALNDRDLSGAVTAYCDAYDGGNTDSQVAFGCYLSKALALPETSDFTAILDDFGEAHLDVANDILGDVVESFVGDTSSGNDVFVYGNYSNLPFNSFLTDDTLTLGGKFAQFAVELNTTGTTAAALQTDIDALYDDFVEMETLLNVALDDEAFSFTIPAGLFGSNSDLTANAGQLQLHMAGVQGTLVSLDVLAAYDFGATATDVVNSTGDDFDYEVLAADLNGTGATVNGVTVDSTPFLTLTNASRITGAETRATEALQHLSDGLATFNGNETITWFGSRADDVTASQAKELIDNLLSSLTGNQMVELGQTHGRTVSVNLKEFFTNPPSAADVTASDPFVFESGTIMMVESYFQSLLNGIAEF